MAEHSQTWFLLLEEACYHPRGEVVLSASDLNHETRLTYPLHP